MIEDPQLEDITVRDLKFICCFCNEDIDPYIIHLGVEIFRSDLEDEEGIAQSFWAHPTCFQNAIHEACRDFLRLEIQEICQ